MDLFVIFFFNEYILVDMSYVSKWLESFSLLNNEGKSVAKFLKSYIFTRFGKTRDIIFVADSLKLH